MRRAVGAYLSCLLACESSEAGTMVETDASTTGTEASTSVGTSGESGWTDTDGRDGSTGGIPEHPPSDEDFEWEPVEPFDCGERGHVIHASGPPENRVNFVILGDGYTASEIDGPYADHVHALLQVMFGSQGFPYEQFVDAVNICRIDVVSAESGIDFPEQGIEVDTALDAQADTITRVATVNLFKLEAELADALAGTDVEPDWVAVALNTPAWVGSGGYPMIWTGGHSMGAEIGLHEAGHSFHALADEYGDDGTRVYEGGEPGEINVTANLQSEKWAAWLGYEQDGLGVIDFYEGARYFDYNMWRPTLDGAMRTVTRPHNAPSIDKMIRDIYTIAGPIDDFSPKIADVYPPALGLRLIDEDRVVVDWEVDGELVLPNAGPRIWTAALGLTPGAHAVRAVVHDPTEWVRAEDRSALEMGVTWPVQVPANLEPNVELAPRETRASTRPQPRLVVTPRTVEPPTLAERPHPLGPARLRTMAANRELLRARDELTGGRLEAAHQRLRAHARDFGDMHASDRAVLKAAVECLAGGSKAAGLATLARHAHGRFTKVLRRACTASPRP